MSTAPLPGRPGNLTAEQEVKLQELWKATLKVFGVPVLGAEAHNGSPNGSEKAESQDGVSGIISTTSPEKKKKKRISLFSRKKHDKEDPEESVHGALSPAPDSDDKYGQTKLFHEALANQTPEELRKTFWSMVKHDNPDGLLLRFLRARKWDVEKALVMMISTMHWRSKEVDVDGDIVWNGEAAALKDSMSADAILKREGTDFLTQLRLGKSFLHGTDKEGRPICFVRVRLHRQGEQTEASLERFTILMLETARLLLSPPVDTAAIVFDMTDFSMANMDYGPVKFMIKCFEANYPESLGVVLVHKAPWVFQGIWHIIKNWLDPVVASKIHFTKSLDELQTFIPPSHIIAELGGEDPWSYKYIEPSPAENDVMNDTATRDKLLEERANTVKEFETATQEWIQNSAAPPVLQKRSALAEQLRTGYWKLDPYVRARTVYDRNGLIKPGGVIEYYPKTNGTAPTPAPETVTSNGPIAASHDPDGLD
ncbi:hypothetical protein MMC30_007501 [Trapelia coarctata]|nr:hypothetical protein [Trapelia coarctata]